MVGKLHYDKDCGCKSCVRTTRLTGSMTRAKSRTIESILNQTQDFGVGADGNLVAHENHLTIDQALKEIQTLIKESKPEKPIYDNRRSPKTTGKVHGTKDFVIGYSDGIDQYEANLLKALE